MTPVLSSANTVPAIRSESENEPVVEQLVQRRDITGELRRLQTALGFPQLVHHGALNHGFRRYTRLFRPRTRLAAPSFVFVREPVHQVSVDAAGPG